MVSARVPDIDSLELLLQVASTGSLGKAAAAHGLTQPAVSARIKAMEALVGFPLVDRGSRGSSLTPAGALLAEWARDVMSAVAVIDAGITSLRGDRESRLQVAASLTIAEHLLPRWLVRLAADRPETVVRLAAMNSADVAAAVLTGSAQLGFVEGPSVPTGLSASVVARDQLVVVAPPGHLWSRRRNPITATELASTRLVQREPSSGTRTWLESALADCAPMAAPLLELSTSSGVRSAVAAGAGPAVLSSLAVDDDVRAGRLAQVAVTGLDLDRPLRAVWVRGQRPSGPAADLLLIARRHR